METSTLRCITEEICGRKIDPILEEYLSQYVSEVAGLLKKIREVSREFPSNLEPAPVFSLKQVEHKQIEF